MILAIDPGSIESAYVLMDEDYKPIDFAKIENWELLSRLQCGYFANKPHLVIEMISSYGMPVGKEVFETCVWIGRYDMSFTLSPSTLIYRKDVKMNLCGQAKAKDGNIIQALKDRFGDKGTKANPGWFYGFKADCWQAYALGVTYLDLQKGE